MPIITDIKQQKRTITRYSVYLDGHYSFSLSDLELSASGLRVGREVSHEEVQVWQDQSIENKAYHLALGYVSRRPRSRREMSDYLYRKDYAPEVIDRVIHRLEEYRFIDDAEFAAAWIRHRQVLRPRSRRALEAELLQKGIDRVVIQVALSELGGEGQERMLMDLIAKKRQQSRYHDPDKLMRYLVRQGFGYDQIKKALARLDDN